MTDYKDMDPGEQHRRQRYIEDFCWYIEKCWKANPDWRFGQLIVNSFSGIDSPVDSISTDAWLFYAKDESFDFETGNK